MIHTTTSFFNDLVIRLNAFTHIKRSITFTIIHTYTSRGYHPMNGGISGGEERQAYFYLSQKMY